MAPRQIHGPGCVRAHLGASHVVATRPPRPLDWPLGMADDECNTLISNFSSYSDSKLARVSSLVHLRSPNVDGGTLRQW